MQAIIINQYGGPEQLQLTEQSNPTYSDQQVLIKTTAAGVNPIDWKTRKGNGIAFLLDDQFPKILGWDVAGVISEVGSSVTLFKPGDRVFGLLNFPQPGNCYAEYVVANANEIAPIPESISEIEAAAVPLAALTAFQALRQMQVQAGKSILIQAAAGGVGHFAVQLAKLQGLKVYATASPRNHEYVKQLGADVIIDYHQHQVADYFIDEKLDYVLDSIAGAAGAALIPYLNETGYICILAVDQYEPVLEAASKAGIRAENFRVVPSADDMQTLADYLADGKLKVTVSEVIAFSDAAKAHQLSESHHVLGKLVLKV